MAVELISRATVRGFRSLRDVDVELRPFTVLVGANGSGKSNFIELFTMLNYTFGSTQGGLQIYVGRKGRASSLLYYGPEVTRHLDLSLMFQGEAGWSRYSASLAWGAPDDLFFTSEKLEFQRSGDALPRVAELGGGARESRVLTVSERASDDWERAVARSFRYRLRQVRAYHFHNTLEEAAIRVSQDLQRESYLLSTGGNIAAFLHKLREDHPGVYSRILASVQTVAPFVRDFELEPETPGGRSIMLKWRDRSDRVFGPHQLSDGTLRAVALITALLQPDETMSSVMIFDEPELGLHPAAVSLIAELLKAASLKRQVIVATQSPLLLRDYGPDDIVVVEREDEPSGRGATVFRRLEADALAGWLEDFDLGELYEKNVTGGYPR